MKRSRGESLTGGTGDINPQTYSLQEIGSNPDTFNVQQFPVPIMRFPIKKGRAMVMEALKAIWIVKDISSVTALVSVIGALSTADPSSLVPNHAIPTSDGLFDVLASPSTFAWYSMDGIFATAAGFQVTSRILEQNLTDSAGHGILVATDNIFLSLGSVGTGAIQEVVCKLIYRFKEVSLEEYIGIVQSQQSA